MANDGSLKIPVTVTIGSDKLGSKGHFTAMIDLGMSFKEPRVTLPGKNEVEVSVTPQNALAEAFYAGNFPLMLHILADIIEAEKETP